MAVRRNSKKRKLPRDLYEASKQAKACIATSSSIVEACSVLRSIELPASTTELSTDDITTYLTARYGLSIIAKVCNVLSGLPNTLNSFNRSKYLSKLTGMDEIEAQSLASFISAHCPEMTAMFQATIPSVLAPPVSECIECQRQLTSNHDCEVTLYTLSGVKHLQKVTLRCQLCGISYNYTMWGRKQSTGFQYYCNQREFVKVTDTVFFTRSLLELQCSLANHAWVSFQGFMESYNDAFRLPKHLELTPRLTSEAFYSGELEAELRLFSTEGKVKLEGCILHHDADREELMERIEYVRSHSIYPHQQCRQQCKERGCGQLWVTDGIWKLTFPHCMHRVKYIVQQIPSLSLPDVCTNSPQPGKAFCRQHCSILEQNSPPIPTDIRGFLKFCGVCTKEPGDVEESTIIEADNAEVLIQQVLEKTTVMDVGTSAALSQGIDEVLSSSPSLVTDATQEDDDSEMQCRKKIGEPKRLRRWSRGHQIVVRAGGHIDSWQPLYKSESPSQVFFILLTWLQALLATKSLSESTLTNIYIAYDNMCNLCKMKVASSPLALPPPMDQAWLKTNRIIDTFHLKNHTSPACHTIYSPAKMKSDHPNFNTQAGEQTFVWMGRFKQICCAMNKNHHLFYVHRMVRRRNQYTEKCYTNGRKPILPALKKT